MKAFPYVIEVPSDKEGYRAYAHEEGMDLRDYFASDAMKGMGANPNDDHDPDVETYDEYCDEVARCAYKMADAMMKAREQK